MQKMSLDPIDYLALVGLAMGDGAPNECRFVIPFSSFRHGLSGPVMDEVMDLIDQAYAEGECVDVRAEVLHASSDH